MYESIEYFQLIRVQRIFEQMRFGYSVWHRLICANISWLNNWMFIIFGRTEMYRMLNKHQTRIDNFRFDPATLECSAFFFFCLFRLIFRNSIVSCIQVWYLNAVDFNMDGIFKDCQCFNCNKTVCFKWPKLKYSSIKHKFPLTNKTISCVCAIHCALFANRLHVLIAHFSLHFFPSHAAFNILTTFNEAKH